MPMTLTLSGLFASLAMVACAGSPTTSGNPGSGGLGGPGGAGHAGGSDADAQPGGAGGTGGTGVGSACKTTLDCAGNLVCDATTSRCVGCTGTQDCGQGMACLRQTCTKVVSCVSDLDCKSQKQLCSKTLGRCVDCFDAAGCGQNALCLDGLCAPLVCNPDEVWCEGTGSLKRCSHDGTVLENTPCGAGSACGGPLDSPLCIKQPPPLPDATGPLTIVVSGWAKTDKGIAVDIGRVDKVDVTLSKCTALGLTLVACPSGTCDQGADANLSWLGFGAAPPTAQTQDSLEWGLTLQQDTSAAVAGHAYFTTAVQTYHGTYTLGWSGPDPSGQIRASFHVTQFLWSYKTPVAADSQIEIVGACR